MACVLSGLCECMHTHQLFSKGSEVGISILTSSSCTLTTSSWCTPALSAYSPALQRGHRIGSTVDAACPAPPPKTTQSKCQCSPLCLKRRGSPAVCVCVCMRARVCEPEKQACTSQDALMASTWQYRHQKNTVHKKLQGGA
eukprot:1158914-Pelagomonas_calceolata.AAC.4